VYPVYIGIIAFIVFIRKRLGPVGPHAETIGIKGFPWPYLIFLGRAKVRAGRAKIDFLRKLAIIS
jgi:hypothetical protein